MSKIGIAVLYKVKSGQRATVLELVKGHAERTKANEPGCLQFEVLVPHDQEDELRLFEMYADADAFKAHTQAPYLARIGQDLKPLLDERIVTVCDIAD